MTFILDFPVVDPICTSVSNATRRPFKLVDKSITGIVTRFTVGGLEVVYGCVSDYCVFVERPDERDLNEILELNRFWRIKPNPAKVTHKVDVDLVLDEMCDGHRVELAHVVEAALYNFLPIVAAIQLEISKF